MSSGNQYPDHFIERLHTVWGKGFLSPGGAEEVAEIVRSVDVAGRTVLDVGFGTGGPAIALISDHDAAKVIGIDVEEPMRDRAQRNIDSADVADRIDLMIVDPGPFPFEPEVFDVVFSKDSLIHISDKPALFAEVLRVLKPGGAFAASDWLAGSDPAGKAALQEYRKTTHLNFTMATADEMEILMTEAGFEHVSTRDRNAWFAARSADEVQKIEGTLYQQLAETIDEEILKGWIETKKAIAKAAAAGGLRPTHLLGRKPRR